MIVTGKIPVEGVQYLRKVQHGAVLFVYGMHFYRWIEENKISLSDFSDFLARLDEDTRIIEVTANIKNEKTAMLFKLAFG